ncbi:MAG: alpha/beta hydrolase [Planctomycetota bacterium]
MTQRQRLRHRFALRTVICLSAWLFCAAAGQGQTNEPAFQVERTLNLRYWTPGSGVRPAASCCDLFLPKRKVAEDGQTQPDRDPRSRRWPIVIVVHGGAWATGDKWTMYRHANKLAERGIASVSINYRHAPSHPFPKQVDDIRSALVWIHEHADQYEFDLDRVGLFGYSAGGHLVSLVATLQDEPWEKVETTTRWTQDDTRWSKLPPIRAVCAGGSPSDFQKLPPDNTSLAYFLGGSRRERPENYRAASTINFVSPDDPPFQLIHGDSDGIVPFANAESLLELFVETGVKAKLDAFPNKGHMLTFISPELTSLMLQFFEDHLQRD